MCPEEFMIWEAKFNIVGEKKKKKSGMKMVFRPR